MVTSWLLFMITWSTGLAGHRLWLLEYLELLLLLGLRLTSLRTLLGAGTGLLPYGEVTLLGEPERLWWGLDLSLETIARDCWDLDSILLGGNGRGFTK